MSLIKNDELHPWLSIIMPIFNAEKFLSTSIKSILQQSFENFELILVDDGSEDLSASICTKFCQEDNRIKYYRKKNGGSFQARLYGLEQATGECVMFCDADDYYVDKHVFRLLYSEMRCSDFSVIQFGFKKKFNHIKIRKSMVTAKEAVMRKAFLERDYPKLLCGHWPESRLTQVLWDKIYHRSLFNKLPSSKNVKRIFWGDDLITNLILLENCESILFIPNVLYVYNDFTGGSTRFSLHTMKDLNSIKEYQIESLLKWKGPRKLEIEKQMYAEVAAWFFIHIKKSLDYISEEDIKKMIRETLNYSAFIEARNYYLENNQNWEAVNLLREANPDKYVSAAKKRELRSVKTLIISFAKEIIKKV